MKALGSTRNTITESGFVSDFDFKVPKLKDCLFFQTSFLRTHPRCGMHKQYDLKGRNSCGMAQAAPISQSQGLCQIFYFKVPEPKDWVFLFRFLFRPIS